MSNKNLEEALAKIEAAIERNERKAAEQENAAIANIYTGAVVGLQEARSYILAWRD